MARNSPWSSSSPGTAARISSRAVPGCVRSLVGTVNGSSSTSHSFGWGNTPFTNKYYTWSKA